MTMVNQYLKELPPKYSISWALKATEEEFEAYLASRVYEKVTVVDEAAAEKEAAYRQRFTGLTRKEQKKYLFESLEVKPENKELIEKAISWDIRKDQGLIIYGSTGVGKTALCKCLINKWGAQGFRCKLITSGDLLDILKAAMNEPSTSVSREQEILASLDLLVLDDLGSELTTEWGLSQIFALINARYENEKPTLVTTNLSQAALGERYGARVYDRLINMTERFVIKMPSFRGKS